MMKYLVIKSFTDMQDNNHKYLAGDIFPREGFSVSDERLEELSTDKNRRKEPMIKKVVENPMPKPIPADEVIEEKEVVEKKPRKKKADVK
jgi:hypothetical protein